MRVRLARHVQNRCAWPVPPREPRLQCRWSSGGGESQLQLFQRTGHAFAALIPFASENELHHLANALGLKSTRGGGHVRVQGVDAFVWIRDDGIEVKVHPDDPNAITQDDVDRVHEVEQHLMALMAPPATSAEQNTPSPPSQSQSGLDDTVGAGLEGLATAVDVGASVATQTVAAVADAGRSVIRLTGSAMGTIMPRFNVPLPEPVHSAVRYAADAVETGHGLIETAMGAATSLGSEVGHAVASTALSGVQRVTGLGGSGEPSSRSAAAAARLGKTLAKGATTVAQTMKNELDETLQTAEHTVSTLVESALGKEVAHVSRTAFSVTRKSLDAVGKLHGLDAKELARDTLKQSLKGARQGTIEAAKKVFEQPPQKKD